MKRQLKTLLWNDSFPKKNYNAKSEPSHSSISKKASKKWKGRPKMNERTLRVILTVNTNFGGVRHKVDTSTRLKNNEKTISESLLADHVSKSFHCFRRRLSCVCVEWEDQRTERALLDWQCVLRIFFTALFLYASLTCLNCFACQLNIDITLYSGKTCLRNSAARLSILIRIIFADCIFFTKAFF